MTALQRFISASGMTNLAGGIAVVACGWITFLGQARLLRRLAWTTGFWNLFNI